MSCDNFSKVHFPHSPQIALIINNLQCLHPKKHPIFKIGCFYFKAFTIDPIMDQSQNLGTTQKVWII